MNLGDLLCRLSWYFLSADLADVASKAGDAKDNVQSAANQIGLE